MLSPVFAVNVYFIQSFFFLLVIVPSLRISRSSGKSANVLSLLQQKGEEKYKDSNVDGKKNGRIAEGMKNSLTIEMNAST